MEVKISLKNRGAGRINIMLVFSVLVIIAGILFLLIAQEKEAVRVTFIEEKTDLEFSNNQTISLLCKTDQMTGVWFVAVAVKDSAGNYQYLNRPVPLYVCGNDPFSILNNELTIYSSNYFILHGELVYGSIFYSAVPEFLMNIHDWDIVYPIETTLRPFFMRRFIYRFEYIAN